MPAAVLLQALTRLLPISYTNTTDYPGSTAGGTFIQSPINVSVSPTAQVSSVSIPQYARRYDVYQT